MYENKKNFTIILQFKNVVQRIVTYSFDRLIPITFAFQNSVSLIADYERKNDMKERLEVESIP